VTKGSDEFRNERVDSGRRGMTVGDRWNDRRSLELAIGDGEEGFERWWRRNESGGELLFFSGRFRPYLYTTGSPTIGSERPGAHVSTNLEQTGAIRDTKGRRRNIYVIMCIRGRGEEGFSLPCGFLATVPVSYHRAGVVHTCPFMGRSSQ
jgi:hypothetical protein